jgi:hypothetical protein
MPIAYGEITNAPVICTNDEEGAPSNYSFKICDTTYHSIKEVTTVYVDGVTKTHSNTSLTNATFTLSTSDYSPGDTVTVDFKGYDDSVAQDGSGTLIDDSLDIIVDLLDNYLGVTYSSDTYNTTEWTAASTYNVAKWIKKKMDIIKVIEEICLSNFGHFIVQGDGKYTYRETDTSAASTKTIEVDELMVPPKAQYKSAEYLTSLIINYDRDEDENEYVEYPYSSEESEVYNLYGTYREREFNTLLVDSADAEALALKIMALFNRIRQVFSVTTKVQTMDVDLVKNVEVRMDRVSKEWYGLAKCQVVGLSYDFNMNRVNLDLRYIEDA